MSVVLALLIGLALVVSASAEEQPLSDLTPLVGKWKGFAKSPQGEAAMEMTIQADGSYAGVVYIRGGAQNLAGTFFLEGGQAVEHDI